MNFKYIKLYIALLSLCSLPQISFAEIETFDNYFEKASEGDSYSAGVLSIAYTTGFLGVNIDLNKAKHWAEKSAEKNHPIGLCNLGIINRLFGDGKKSQNYFEDTFLNGGLLRLKNKNDPFAHYCLGQIFFLTKPVDHERALRSYKKATDLNFSPAMSSLAIMYILGIGTEKKVDEGIRLLEKAVKLNSPLAMFNLSTVYRDGVGVTKDTEKSFNLLKGAAERGFPIAKKEFVRVSQLRAEKTVTIKDPTPKIARTETPKKPVNKTIASPIKKIEIKTVAKNKKATDNSQKANPTLETSVVELPKAKKASNPSSVKSAKTILKNALSRKTFKTQPSQAKRKTTPIKKPTINVAPKTIDPPKPKVAVASSSKPKKLSDFIKTKTKPAATQPIETKEVEKPKTLIAKKPPTVMKKPTVKTIPIAKVLPKIPNGTKPESLNNEALAILAKKSTTKNYQHAFHLFEASAKQGDPVGQRFLGILYLYGRGVDASDKSAKHWLTQSKTRGDEISKVFLKNL